MLEIKKTTEIPVEIPIIKIMIKLIIMVHFGIMSLSQMDIHSYQEVQLEDLTM